MFVLEFVILPRLGMPVTSQQNKTQNFVVKTIKNCLR